MKKIIFPVALVAAIAVSSCGGGGKWSDEDVKKFNETCNSTMVGQGAPEDAAKKVCDCSLEKIQKEYSSYAEADKGDVEKIKELMMGCAEDVKKEYEKEGDAAAE